MLDTCERYLIYEISKEGIQLNGNFAEIYDHIYDVIMAIYRSTKNEKQQN
jgi:hypothetical protein